MDLHALKAFEKVAISSGATLRLLQGRAAQGARIAPNLMARAEQAAASGAKTTAPGMRSLALEAGGAARSQQAVRGLAPMKADLRSRIRQADAMGAGAHGATPLRDASGGAFGQTHAYSVGHVNTLTGSRAQIADPKGLLASSARPATGATATAVPMEKTRAPGLRGGAPRLAPMAGVNA